MSDVFSDAPPPLSRFFARFDVLVCAAARKPGALAYALLRDVRGVSRLRDDGRDIGVRRLARAEADLEALAARHGVTLPPSLVLVDSEGAPPRNPSCGEG